MNWATKNDHMPNTNHILTDISIEKQESPNIARSDEVQEIMGKYPSWITNWGITLMGTIICGLLIGAWFFKYPDIIPAKVTITSGSPPVKVIAMSSLPLQKIFVKNEAYVEADQILGILSNAAQYADVIQVASIASKIDTSVDLRKLILDFKPATGLNLGELQNSFIAMFQALNDYRFFLSHNNYGNKIAQLSEQSGYQSKLSKQLFNNNNKLKEQLEIQQSRFTSDSILVEQTVMSKLEYETARKELLSQQISTEGNYVTILESKLQEKEIQKNISETAIQLQTDENVLQQKIRDAAKTFNGDYANWEQKYILRTPVSGNVSFFKFWKENQFVRAGEVVMIVTPPAEKFVARGNISIVGAGKTKPGQQVIIKLLAYPYEEYGSLKGIVKSRSIVALDTTFSIEINLQNGLKTNAGKVIPNQPEIEGLAEIMTENRNILQRLFENLYGKRR